jgi:hypothetical protein
MSLGRIGAGTALGAVGVLVTGALIAAPSWAAGRTKLCVPKKEGAGLVTPKHGRCKKGYQLTTLGAEGKAGAEGKQGAAGKPGTEGKQGPEGRAGFTPEQAEQLKALLPYVRFVGNGIAGKPTVQFSGVNVQIVNAAGKTESTNGEGNLVIGYDEEPGEQTGSHNLILGEEQTFTSFGGIDGGNGNRITAPFASVVGGGENIADAGESSVSGGFGNTASGEGSSVSGGSHNTASGEASSVSGGDNNTASDFWSSVSGGELNRATGFRSSVSAGLENTASGDSSSVSGGEINTASGNGSSVSGGGQNKAKAPISSIFGGDLQETTALYEAKP